MSREMKILRQGVGEGSGAWRRAAGGIEGAGRTRRGVGSSCETVIQPHSGNNTQS